MIDNKIGKQEHLQQLLKVLRLSIPEIQGAFVAGHDGLPIVHSLPAEMDVLRVSAVAATAQGIGRRVIDMLQCGQLSEVSVAGTEGLVFLYTAGNHCVLGILSQSESNVGLINLEARDCARKIAELFS